MFCAACFRFNSAEQLLLPVCGTLLKIENILNWTHFHNFWLSFPLKFLSWNDN